jgi:hypothetical protein
VGVVLFTRAAVHPTGQVKRVRIQASHAMATVVRPTILDGARVTPCQSTRLMDSMINLQDLGRRTGEHGNGSTARLPRNSAVRWRYVSRCRPDGSIYTVQSRECVHGLLRIIPSILQTAPFGEPPWPCIRSDVAVQLRTATLARGRCG